MDHGVVMYSLLICKKSLVNGTGKVSKVRTIMKLIATFIAQSVSSGVGG